MNTQQHIGFSCAYTPLALIHAAGFTPYRILPNVDCPDQAGRLLHDNLCPHVKRILDRAMSRKLPDLAGMVFMNSCDAMRRLADAWRVVRPDVPSLLVDLPTTTEKRDASFFRKELQKLEQFLEEQGGESLQGKTLAKSITAYNRLADAFGTMQHRIQTGGTSHGALLLQEAYLTASCMAPETMLKNLEKMLTQNNGKETPAGIPIYLFGNVLPETEAFALFESCGARIVGEDLCTGSRLFTEIAVSDGDLETVMAEYTAGLLGRKPCARTICEKQPGKMAEDIVADARRHNAKGVIGYTVKFCDPYVARLPGIRAALKKEGFPFLLLEGDCTVRSLGQHKTRIEAFIEMLG